MTIDTKKLREMAEKAMRPPRFCWSHSSPNCDNNCDCEERAEASAVRRQREPFHAAANPQTVLALLDEIERLQAQKKSDNQELLMAACEIEDLRDRLTTMTEARNEIYTVAKRTFDLKLMTLEEATRLDKLRSVGTDEVGQ